ncbi:hypothetical protein DEU56DRAFT_769751 [Suillus clintonianus]|uniref:uncharacterized protein n=1 Tax=Suillus clintonianus TaxID=1904413 RepID=UPI001B87EEA7|nr:uncharacterized protein DEU56DRAFT_769751 [Suillus clintonianus]KAG2154683.1 hypothetical protein DEU56DRAFT_769751 [Suillus clintonianus]
MTTAHRTKLHTKFYQEDIVRRIDSPNVYAYGIVLRCWHDAEDIPPLPSPFMDPLMRSVSHRPEVVMVYLEVLSPPFVHTFRDR